MILVKINSSDFQFFDREAEPASKVIIEEFIFRLTLNPECLYFGDVTEKYSVKNAKV